MEKSYRLFFIFIFFQLFSIAQNPLVKQWDFRYGGTGNEKLSMFEKTIDGGFILGGVSSSGATGDKTQPSWGNSDDYWIVKINQYGNYQWDKRFGGTRTEVLKSILQTHDKGYLLCGYSNSGISGDKTQANWDNSGNTTNPTNDFWIVKTDSVGNKLWDKRFGGNYDDKFSSLVQANDGGYLLAGFSASGISGDKTQASWGSTDFWVVKLDAYGNKQWDRRYGGVNNEQLYTVCLSDDGGFLLGGYSWSPISGDKSEPNFGAPNYCDYWIVKTDRNGNKLWDKRYGGSLNDQLSYAMKTMDGGYVLGGYSWSGISGEKTKVKWGLTSTSDYWMIKIDSIGNFQWDQDFGGIEREDDLGNIIQTSDGGYLLCSTSYSGISGNKSENNLGPEQTWILKTDYEGNKTWDKTILTSGHDETGWVAQTTDGCYAIANYTNADESENVTQPNRDPSLLTNDYWIAKFCDTSQTIVQCTTPDQTICSGSCIDFTNLSQGYDSFIWLFPGASPATDTSINPQHICYGIPGYYQVKLIAFKNNSSDTLVLNNYIRVNPQPQPFSISIFNNTLVVPQVFAAYQWYFQNQPINGANDYLLVPVQDGNYSISVTDNNGCQARAEIRSIVIGIDDLANRKTWLEIFPNPAMDILYILITAPSPVANANIVIRNVLGEAILEEKMIGERSAVNIKNFPAGIYFVEVTTSEKRLIRKFIKL